MREDEELAAIWAEFREATLARVAVLEAAAAAAAAGMLDNDARAAARAEAHTLAGTAAIFGRAEIARLARELERSFDVPGAVGSVEGARVLEAARALRREV